MRYRWSTPVNVNVCQNGASWPRFWAPHTRTCATLMSAAHLQIPPQCYHYFLIWLSGGGGANIPFQINPPTCVNRGLCFFSFWWKPFGWPSKTSLALQLLLKTEQCVQHAQGSVEGHRKLQWLSPDFYKLSVWAEKQKKTKKKTPEELKPA